MKRACHITFVCEHIATSYDTSQRNRHWCYKTMAHCRNSIKKRRATRKNRTAKKIVCSIIECPLIPSNIVYINGLSTYYSININNFTFTFCVWHIFKLRTAPIIVANVDANNCLVLIIISIGISITMMMMIIYGLLLLSIL